MADTLACGMVDGVGDGCGGGALRGFAGAQGGLVGAVDDDDFDLGGLVHVEDRVRGPVAAGNVMLVEANLFEECPAGGLDHAAFDLVFDAVEVDDFAGVDDGPEVCDFRL